ncbi:MAG: glycosyltransferase, partial [Bacteroidetes bacterium]|nr:glycosyltransferase [Bacteroidota bacterium]
VEDASTDNSLQVLKRYQEKETRLKIIEHGVNKKLSIARSTGMKASRGDYIMHVDSDDWLLPNAFENLYEKCVECDADVIVFNHVKENNNGKRVYINSVKKGLITSDKLKVQPHFFGAPWNKIVKRYLVENMIFGQVGLNNTEDLLYASEILLKAKRICLSPESYYTYFVNTDSLTNMVKSEQYIQNQIIILKQLQNIIYNNKTNLKLTYNILNYFEKWIYLEFARIQFWNKEKLIYNETIVKELSRFAIMSKSRIRRLKLALRFKYINLIEVSMRFGFLMSLGIIRRSLRNKL